MTDQGLRDRLAVRDRMSARRMDDDRALQRRYPQHAEHILGYDDEGWMFAHDPIDRMWWRITECCGASDKGYEDGVFCRGCAGEIPFEVSCPVVLGGVEIPLYSIRTFNEVAV